MGGGPSLKGFSANILRGRAVVAINNSYKLAPWADLLYAADRRWFEWHAMTLPMIWGGNPIYTRVELTADPCRSWPVHKLRHAKDEALSRDPGAVAGWDSGSNAINLAWLAGAAKIVLLGFDGGTNNGMNWHEGEHRSAIAAYTYPKYIIPSLDRMAFALRAAGARVLNATPGSALTCFPKAELTDLL